jgi:hypothetical protein
LKSRSFRTAFLEAGKVPSELMKLTWDAFKTAVRNFNSLKTPFTKTLKRTK